MLALPWARPRSSPQGVLVIYFGSAASWRPCNVVWPHQGLVPHSRRLYGEPYAQCNKVALGTTREVLWCYVSDKESMWKRYEDDEKALSWAELTQVDIDKIWSRLANDMEEEVLTRYIVKTEARYKGRSTPLMWVYQTSETGRKHGFGF